MTRNGKISHPPRTLRDHLNQRLEYGEPSKSLVKRLNTRGEVKTILAAHFAAHPISGQNLSKCDLERFPSSPPAPRSPLCMPGEASNRIKPNQSESDPIKPLLSEAGRGIGSTPDTVRDLRFTASHAALLGIKPAVELR